MPFNDESSYKQRLNLSPLAHEIISNDMSIFEEERYSTFINKIFKNYHEKANMSIKKTLDHYRNELNELLYKIQSEVKTQVIDRLIKDQEYKLKKEADSYEKGEQSSFCINKENLIYLETICEEDKYFKRGKYIKCILEEYARLPFIEREAIYFQSNIETIENAIRAKVQLRIVTEANSVFSVYPYKILSDPLSTRNYLVGYSKRYNSEDTLLPCSFRISTLKSVSPEKSKSAFLKKEKISALLNTSL